MNLFPLVSLAILLCLGSSFAAEEAKGNKTDNCNKENCPWHLWNHYEAKGCKPIYKDGECCPVAFNCTAFDDNNGEDGCQFKGQFYKQGEVINTTNPCHKCRCAAKGITSCTISECFTEANLPNCIPLFVHSECCPMNQYCLPLGKKSLEEVADATVCKYEGKTYVEDQIIELKDHPCLTCICKKGFNGPDSPSCKKVECSFPGNNLKMKRGCVPVYMNSRCCSIDWICPPADDDVEEKAIEGGCRFGERHFPLGASLDLRDPCTICNCTTPTDFTCIRTQCSGPPNGDFVNCRPIPSRQAQCCHDFHCIPPGSIPPGVPFPDGQGPPRPNQSQQPSQ
uniref:VWFC domain-containing protein n=1 Tax=Strigamia maritima TaxID=126957 RepID=T1JDP6_STRMM